jgi:conjugal transfer pilus assembly protein TraW
LGSLLGIAGLHAKDLGVQGKVWPITEIDMRELLVRNAADKDARILEDEMRAAVDRHLNGLPKREMSKVTQTQTTWFDPSFVLDQDIKAPMKNAQGEWEWAVLHAKGTKFNPLSVQRPATGLFFFDATSEEEVAFAAAMDKEFPGKLRIIEASGANPERLALQIGSPVFVLTDAIVARFKISATPSLLYPGEGLHALELGLTTFAPPFAPAQAERAWPSIRIKIPGAAK